MSATSMPTAANGQLDGAPVASPAALALAREVIAIEAAAVAALAARIDADFQRAVDLLLACRGRVVVSGVGKSGHMRTAISA